jgi:hypothetical protein
MAVGHVFVVAAGFGKRVIPMGAPYRFAIGDRGSLLVSAAGGASAAVARELRATATQAIGSNVADVFPGPDWPAWYLEAGPYCVPLPEGWTAHASGSIEPAAFDLVGPRDSLIFIQTPGRVPPVDRMVVPGQEIIGRGSLAAGEWIAVRYLDQGVEYVQRHARVSLVGRPVVVTLQCDSDSLVLVESTHQFLVDNLLPASDRDD